MQPTDISQFTAIAAKLHQIRDAMADANAAMTGSDSKYNQAYERLQTLLAEFKADPGNTMKSKSMLRAADTYQTSIDLMLYKTRTLMEKAKDAGVDTSSLQRKYGKVIKELIS